MVFSSAEFLCAFLPLTLLLYYLCPRRARNLLLFLVSLAFYAYGERRYIFIMLFSTFFDYGNGRFIEYFDRRGKQWGKRLVLILSLVVNLGLMCFFKYTDFVITNVNTAFGTAVPLLRLALPLGISFYTFQTLSYTIDVYRGNVKAQHNLIDFGMYISMFPQLIAGPIVRYSDVQGELKDRSETPERVTAGILRFVTGLGKKVLLANLAGALWEEIAASSLTVPTAWIGAVAYALHIYFDFSGYSDMAIGLGGMLGFRFPENFRYPYLCTSATDFWRRWHITLSTWFREYLYIPLGGNRKGLPRQILNLLIVWFLTGLWHGAGWNFIAWGLYYFVLLTLEKLFLLRRLEKLPKFFRHLLALIGVLVGWMLFAAEDLPAAWEYIKAMFGFAPLAGGMAGYYLYTNAVLLAVGMVGCTPLPKRMGEALCRKSGKAGFWLKVGFALLIFAASLLLVVSSGYNPFLYFRF